MARHKPVAKPNPRKGKYKGKSDNTNERGKKILKQLHIDGENVNKNSKSPAGAENVSAVRVTKKSPKVRYTLHQFYPLSVVVIP